MNREDIIRMARDISNTPHDAHTTPDLFGENQIVKFFQAAYAAGAAAERENYDNLFSEIKAWSEAYPISTFPEPDFKKAHKVLSANGMTLDAISASNMRHVITQVQKMIDAAIRARGAMKSES